MWNKSGSSPNSGNANAIERMLEREKEREKGGKSTERKIIETIKNRLNWGCENGNPQFFHLHILSVCVLACVYVCLSVIFGMERYKIFGAIRQWKTRMEQQKKCDGNVMDWILCVFVAKQSQIDAVILVANRKCNISKVSYRYTKNGFAHWGTGIVHTEQADTHNTTQYDINIQMRDSKKESETHTQPEKEGEGESLAKELLFWCEYPSFLCWLMIMSPTLFLYLFAYSIKIVTLFIYGVVLAENHVATQ